MIKYRVEEKQQFVKHTYIDEMVCDLCGKIVKNTDEWKTGYDFEETTVQIKIGCRYPEYYDCDTTSFDICPNCFKNKLIPWLKEQGAVPTEKNRYC